MILQVVFVAAGVLSIHAGCSSARPTEKPDGDTRRHVSSNADAVRQFVADSQYLTQRGDYTSALKIITQIQAIDPQNEYAIAVKPILLDRSQRQGQRKSRESSDEPFAEHSKDSAAKPKSYSDVLTYPPDWPDLSRRGEPGVTANFGLAPADDKVPNFQLQSSSGSRGGNGGAGGSGPSGVFIGPATQPAAPAQTQPQDKKRLADRQKTEEELLIIERDKNAAAAEAFVPGTGAMTARPASKTEAVAIPLKHTDVKANVAGFIASVDVTQQFHNPYAEKIEATYVFPLPHNAAVNDFLMTIGDRKIRGIVRERAEAEKIYAEAKAQGYVASLLTQERPNIFTQVVANIEPGKSIDVSIRYFNTLAYVDGAYEFVFPMVVGPRFNPPGQTDGVGAVGRGEAGASGQSTEVQYLKPTERSGHDIALSVHVDAGVAMESVDSRNHRVTVDRRSPEVVDVTLAADDRVPNKDFVLRFGVAGKTLKSSAVACRDDKGNGYFTLMLVPPESSNDLPRQPLEMVFTFDTSGSMSGPPLEQEKAAVRYALRHMNAGDTFQLINFDDDAKKLFQQPLPADAENVRQAMQWLDTMQSGGGTMLNEGMRASLSGSAGEGRLRFVSFLTDGYIGNESEVLREVHNGLGTARIFSFGIGSSPNRYLLEHMAKVGRGVSAFVGLNDDAGNVMADHFGRISKPALAMPAIDVAAARVSDIFPESLPDVFAGRPVIVSGRFTGDAPKSLRVRGSVGGKETLIDVPVRIEDRPAVAKALPAVWARAKIAELGDRQAWEPNLDTAGTTRQLALEYGLMSPYTAMIAVDSLAKTTGDHGTSVAVPVPVPDGVRYETTVTER